MIMLDQAITLQKWMQASPPNVHGPQSFSLPIARLVCIRYIRHLQQNPS